MLCKEVGDFLTFFTDFVLYFLIPKFLQFSNKRRLSDRITFFSLLRLYSLTFMSILPEERIAILWREALISVFETIALFSLLQIALTLLEHSSKREIFFPYEERFNSLSVRITVLSLQSLCSLGDFSKESSVGKRVRKCEYVGEFLWLLSFWKCNN